MDKPTDKIAKEDQESASTANETFTITRKGKEITLDAARSPTTTFTVHSTKPIRGRAELLIGYKEGQPKGDAARPASDRQEKPVVVQDPYEMPEGLQVDIKGVREHEFRGKDAKDYQVHLSVLGGKTSGGAKVSGGAEESGGAEGSGDAKGSSGAEGTPAHHAPGEGQAGEGPAVKSNPLQVTVAGAQPGAYWLRLDMVDVENPDDMRAKGPPVEFVVPRRPFPWWIVAAAAGVLVLVAIGVAVLLWSRVKVPDVGGQPEANAKATLLAAGLTVTRTMTTTSETVTPGWVAFTTPGAATRVPRGSGVMLILSGGPGRVAVPDVRVQHQAWAVATLVAVGLKEGSTSTVPDPNVTPGWVVATTPGPGAEVERGSKVALVLSGGPEMVIVPNVERMKEEDARATLAAAKLTAGPSSKVMGADVPPGEVIDTDPEPGTSLPKDSTVDLYVSIGPQPPIVDFYMDPLTGTGQLTVRYFDRSCGESDCERTWDFGDGQRYSSTKRVDGEHTYTSDGVYTVTLTITNSVGQDFHLTKPGYIRVGAMAPEANFQFSPTTPVLPDSRVTFTDISTGKPSSWRWDFGDGAKSEEQSPSHQYGRPGEFTVTLTVKNEAGETKKERTVTIGMPACLDQYETEWTELWTEDKGPNWTSKVSCAPGFVAGGVKCKDPFCGKMSLICCRYSLGTDDKASTHELEWFSEEQTNPQYVQGEWLQGVACRRNHCDDLQLTLVQTDYLKSGQCHAYVRFSEEDGGIGTCPFGEYVAGLKCTKGIMEFFPHITITPKCQCTRLRSIILEPCCPENKPQSLSTSSRGQFCDEIQLWCCPAEP